MVVVGAAGVVAESLLGGPGRLLGGACQSSREEEDTEERVFRNQKRMLALLYSNSATLATSLHTRHQDNAPSPLKNNALMHFPFRIALFFSQGCRCVSFSTLPVVSGLPSLQQSHIDLGYTLLIIGSMGKSPPSFSCLSLAHRLRCRRAWNSLLVYGRSHPF
jgi:hypothetical protein